MLTLANDRRLRAQIGESARRTVVKHCSWNRAAADLEQLYFDLTMKQPLRYDVELASALASARVSPLFVGRPRAKKASPPNTTLDIPGLICESGAKEGAISKLDPHVTTDLSSARDAGSGRCRNQL